MKTILLFFFAALTNSLVAQEDIYRPFKIDKQFILADTNGNIPVSERFDDVDNMISHKSEYIVGAKGKYGVVKEGKYVFPLQYTSITPIYTGVSPYHSFMLEQSGKRALGTVDGTILSGFDYSDISKYEIRSPVTKELISKDGGVFFLANKGAQVQLFYVNESGKSMLLTKEPVDDFHEWNGFLVFRKEKSESLYQFDPATFALKEILPFSEQYIEFRGDFYVVWSPISKTAKTYTYDHQFQSSNDIVSIPSTVSRKHLRGKEPEGPLPASSHSVPKTLDIERDRAILTSGKPINVIRSFEQRYVLYSINNTKYYLAKMTVAGSKGDWIVKSHFFETIEHNRQQDTTFQVNADEVILKTDKMSRFLVTRKGDLYGAIDSRGNELLPAKFSNPEYIRSKYDEEWLLIREAKRSILVSYNPRMKKLDTIFTGNADDELDIYGYFIRVKQHLSKNMTRMKLVKMKDFVKFNEAQIIDNNEFFDSIVYCQSFPYFFHVYKDGKAGMLSNETTLIVPCEYDSVRVNAYYLTEVKYGNPKYTYLQPIISAFQNGKQHILRPTPPKNDDDFAEVPKTLIPSFQNGTLNASAKISDDGLYVIDNLRNNLTDIYAINGKKLTKEPIVLHPGNQKTASFSESISGYWFLRGTDQKNREVLVGQNGAWFVLP
jgi:hypothetical protein